VRPLRLVFFLALLVPFAGCAGSKVRPDLVYDDTHFFGRYDLYEPTSGPVTDRPAIVMIHGGAWMSGNKTDNRSFAELMCSKGYVVLAVNYRLTKEGPGWKGATWPTQLEDCQAAVRYFRAHAADLGIRADRVGAFGVSAGAHLATMLALRDDRRAPSGQERVTCTFEADGEHDMVSLPPEKVMDNAVDILTCAFGHGAPWSKAELEDISTVTFARKDASVFVLHGEGDTNVYVVQADRLHDALTAKGADVEMIKLTGARGICHGNCWRDSEVSERMVAFFDKRLKGP